jgi:hypothetical protein
VGTKAVDVVMTAMSRDATMRCFRPFTLLMSLSCAFGTATAQKTPDRPPIDLSPPPPPESPSKGDPFSGSIVGDWAFPVGAFRQHEDGGGGFYADGAYALDRARHLSLRLDGGFLVYGLVNHDMEVPEYDNFGNFLGYQNVSYAVREHQMYSLDIGPEITALTGNIRPYAFATAGMSYFYSSVNVQPPQYAGDQGIDRTVSSAGNFAWSTGVGLRIGGHEPRSGAFDIGIRFRRNERAHYANDSALSTLSDGTVVATPFYGSANVLQLYAGFWIGPKKR